MSGLAGDVLDLETDSRSERKKYTAFSLSRSSPPFRVESASPGATGKSPVFPARLVGQAALYM